MIIFSQNHKTPLYIVRAYNNHANFDYIFVVMGFNTILFSNIILDVNSTQLICVPKNRSDAKKIQATLNQHLSMAFYHIII